MANIKQYRPVNTDETADYYTLSVRMIRDLADSINNAKYWCTNHKGWAYLFPEEMQSKPSGHTGTVEIIRGMFAPRIVPSEYNSLRITVSGQDENATADCTWKFYASRYLYRDPEDVSAVYDANKWPNSSFVKSASFTMPDSGNDIFVNQITNITTGPENLLFVMLTATNAQATTLASINSIDITAQIV